METPEAASAPRPAAATVLPAVRLFPHCRAYLGGGLLGLALGAGCIAPGIALFDVSAADAELAAARTAEAPKWAPYEYTCAELYLRQAKNRLGYSGSYYQEAYEYAERAQKFARQAKEKAENHPKE